MAHTRLEKAARRTAKVVAVLKALGNGVRVRSVGQRVTVTWHSSMWEERHWYTESVKRMIDRCGGRTIARFYWQRSHTYEIEFYVPAVRH